MKMKRFLSLALVVVMLVSTLAVGASALESGKKFGFYVYSDSKKSDIVPGATITVYVRYQMEDFGQLMSDLRLAMFYDSSVYTADLTSREFLNDAAGYCKAATKPTINPAFATTTKGYTTMSDEEKNSFDTCAMITMSYDSGLGATARAGYSITEDSDMPGYSLPELKISFNVTGDASALENGNLEIMLSDCSTTKAQYIKYTDGSSTPKTYPTSDVSMAEARMLANMAVEPAGPKVEKSKAQLKFTANAEKTAVEDNFQLRVTSVITDADWDAYFAGTQAGEATNAIQSVGIVAYKGAAFDESVAKSLVTNGGSATDYEVARTDYIQKTSDDADAYFGAIVKVAHSTLQNDVTYIGFVEYLDATGTAQVAFYETVGTAALVSNYSTYVTNYLAR